MVTWQWVCPNLLFMEDAATTEIARSQIWQWLHSSKAVLDDGRTIDTNLFHRLMAEELDKIKMAIGAQQYASRRFQTAAELIDKIIMDDQFVEFLTLPAYQYLN